MGILLFGGIRLNLPELTLSVSFSIITNHDGGWRANMAIFHVFKTFNVLNILSYPVSTI